MESTVNILSATLSCILRFLPAEFIVFQRLRAARVGGLNLSSLPASLAHIICQNFQVRENCLMPALSTSYEHIIIEENGVPTIEGTSMKVVELVLETVAYGWSPEELHFQHPYLSLGQIHSALAYYWDHAEELDRDIERRLEKVENIRQKVGVSNVKDKLKAKGLI